MGEVAPSLFSTGGYFKPVIDFVGASDTLEFAPTIDTIEAPVPALVSLVWRGLIVSGSSDENDGASISPVLAGGERLESPSPRPMFDKDHNDKFDSKIDVGIFLEYAPRSKAYRVFNKQTLVVEESINVTFDESNIGLQDNLPRDDDEIEEGMELLQLNYKPSMNAPIDGENINEQTQEELPKAWKFAPDHPKDQIIGSPSKGILTRSKAMSECGNVVFLSQIEPKRIDDALKDEF
ncbi:uncharacterized protein A4U43_C01F19950 [Asparagus officinalis]|uniref:Retroviral polymerase SH3-like domain-containing protein n=1 Tax=Asparagus officinalis TaxID=4686 RepID=A0A5P1FQZ3_ASPOF|nr:uncharacterized protein A4U43_C01F19950 [Asparagus officinalis]